MSHFWWTSSKVIPIEKLASFRWWAKGSREAASEGPTVLHIPFCSFLARPYLMALYVIFLIRSRHVLKATIHRKNSKFFCVTWESFFSKEILVHAYCIWLIFPFCHDLFLFSMFLYLRLINYFCHITFYTYSSSSILVRDFPCSRFLFIF